jgi:hypothetical protein
VPCHWDVLGEGDMAPRILNLVIIWSWVFDQLHVPAAISPCKEPRFPLDRRLCGPRSRSGRGGEEVKNPIRHRETKPGHPARSLVAILTELPWLYEYSNSSLIKSVEGCWMLIWSEVKKTKASHHLDTFSLKLTSCGTYGSSSSQCSLLCVIWQVAQEKKFGCKF